ncbi:MAG: hypothetical protein U5R48_06160 [Gammaproteobacteria bacterium]|nr:hypothetical protein [Gammaproteobacteria bacterium]
MATASDDDDFDLIVDDDIDVIGADEEEGETVARVGSPARLLAVRRAIEARPGRNAKRMPAVDYLELDFDDEE